MYFWQLNRLIDELALGDPPPRASLGYVLLTVLPVAAFVRGFLPVRPGDWPAEWALPWRVMVLGIVVFGVLMAYRANGGDTGQRFMGRFFSLYWVLTVRLTVLLFLPLTMLSFLMIPRFERLSLGQFLNVGLPGAIFQVFLYWRMARAMRRIVRGSSVGSA